MPNLPPATSPDRIDWKAALCAGLIAGLVFMMMEMILVAVAGGGSPWGPPRMIAAMVMGEQVLPPPATFDAGVFTVAMIVHFVLSIVLAFVFAWVASRWRMNLGVAVLVGAVFGFLVYLINFYPVAAALFPWFAMGRNWITIVSHIAFGLVLAWSYVAIARKARTR